MNIKNATFVFFSLLSWNLPLYAYTYFPPFIIIIIYFIKKLMPYFLALIFINRKSTILCVYFPRSFSVVRVAKQSKYFT